MNKRRNYFIKKRFQAGFFVRFAALLILEAIVIAGLFMFVSRGTLTTAYNTAGLTIQKTGVYFLLDFVFISCIAGACIGIAGILVFLFLSHRIGGPLYKVEKTIEEARYGNIAKRVDLRKTDQLLDLRDQMNDFLEETDQRISAIKADVNKALQLASEGGEANTARLKEVLQRLKSALDHFKTSK